MEKLGLPIAFAAALHGAVLFGFNHKSPKAPPPPKEITRYDPVDLRPPLEEPDPIILAQDPSEAKPAQPDAPQPVVSPEPLAVIVDGGFTIDPPKIPVNINSDIREIIPPTAGVVGGTGDKVAWGDITGLVGLDRTPATRLQVSPIYPYEAKKNGLTGQVVVDFVVDERGDVVQAKVVSSSDRVFEEPTIRAVMKWKFEPGKRSGRVVPFRMAIPLHFSLND